jgi:hypothetical protein
MTFEEINPIPPLEMGKATYRQTIRASKQSNEPELNSLSKTPIKVESKTIN